MKPFVSWQSEMSELQVRQLPPLLETIQDAWQGQFDYGFKTVLQNNKAGLLKMELPVDTTSGSQQKALHLATVKKLTALLDLVKMYNHRERTGEDLFADREMAAFVDMFVKVCVFVRFALLDGKYFFSLVSYLQGLVEGGLVVNLINLLTSRVSTPQSEENDDVMWRVAKVILALFKIYENIPPEQTKSLLLLLKDCSARLQQEQNKVQSSAAGQRVDTFAHGGGNTHANLSSICYGLLCAFLTALESQVLSCCRIIAQIFFNLFYHRSR